ncbi:MAG TPA: four helix bundle protein [Candidatus Eisenbacteria bacterium]|nr:four helix bundle protein [Candidatus Eisenbacteria bacterium]
MKNDRELFKQEFKKRLYSFVLHLIKFLDKLPKDVISQVILKQLIRSGTSILANYIEAQAASSKKDFTNFFHYSLKSANESKVWLAIIRDTNRADTKENAWLLNELDELSKIFGSSIVTLKEKK